MHKTGEGYGAVMLVHEVTTGRCEATTDKKPHHRKATVGTKESACSHIWKDDKASSLQQAGHI